MPRYFVHLCDRVDRLLDPEGRMASPADLPALVLAEARALIAQDALTGQVDLAQRIEVENESGQLVYSLAFRDAVTIRRRPPAPSFEARG